MSLLYASAAAGATYPRHPGRPKANRDPSAQKRSEQSGSNTKILLAESTIAYCFTLGSSDTFIGTVGFFIGARIDSHWLTVVAA
jgi:hypothetical protein